MSELTQSLSLIAITKRIWLGPFLTQERGAQLQSLGVTHVLNVSEAPSIVAGGEFGLECVRDIPVPDLELIPDSVAIACVNALHEMLQVVGSKVYVHCIAGQNRSPTILWLYFLACGMPRETAKALIEFRARDAAPGRKSMVDHQLAARVETYGRQFLQSLADETHLEPA
jgi:protein-tyrosine phosphatase